MDTASAEGSTRFCLTCTWEDGKVYRNRDSPGARMELARIARQAYHMRLRDYRPGGRARIRWETLPQALASVDLAEGTTVDRLVEEPDWGYGKESYSSRTDESLGARTGIRWLGSQSNEARYSVVG